jgi:hypothetical protein
MVHIRNSESHLCITNLRESWRIANGGETAVLQALHCHEMGIPYKQHQVTIKTWESTSQEKHHVTSRTVVHNLWYAYPCGYEKIILVMEETAKEKELK